MFEFPHYVVTLPHSINELFIFPLRQFDSSLLAVWPRNAAVHNGMSSFPNLLLNLKEVLIVLTRIDFFQFRNTFVIFKGPKIISGVFFWRSSCLWSIAWTNFLSLWLQIMKFQLWFLGWIGSLHLVSLFLFYLLYKVNHGLNVKDEKILSHNLLLIKILWDNVS